MPPRMNPVILLGLVVVCILSLAISAGALQPIGDVMGGLTTVPQQLTGGGGGAALGVGEAQMGKPFQMATDGPNSFSCSGLMRYILRTTGVDADAPWSPEGYLSKYAPVAPGDLQPGDIVIYPNWATMYAGNGMLLNSNEVLGYVTHTPMDVAGVPEGIVRPYSQPLSDATQPSLDQSTAPLGQQQNLDQSTAPLGQQPSLDQSTAPLGQQPSLDQSTAPLEQQQYLDQPIAPLTQPLLDQGTDPLMQPPLP
ncbi:MAG: NlpC/P60 family protein [Actinobacteria bacterium]|nr:NlpC/P60 family protein [Actinomycetota bacterium]